MDITKILEEKYPGEEWSLDGDDYEGLVWHSASAKPTKAELEGAWEDVYDTIRAREVRKLRDQLLLESDWVVNAGERLTAKKKAAYEAYRKALFDITEHANFPGLLPEDWPHKPE